MFSILSSSTDPDRFWPLMGPFFASKAIRKEFNGYPLNDSIHHEWVILADPDIRAFLGLDFSKLHKGESQITEMWVHPEHRGEGIASKMFHAAMERISTRGASRVVVCANPGSPSHKIFLKDGFTIRRMNGSYTWYEKELLPLGG